MTLAQENSSKLVLTGNLWSLAGYPSPETEWRDEEKIGYFADEGYDAVTMAGRPGLGKWLREEFGLRLCGFFQASTLQEIEPAYLRELEAGAETINCFLGTPVTTREEGVRMIAELEHLEQKYGLPAHIETHRATMLEVPEFSLDLYQACFERTGCWPRLCLDDSHIAVVKHFTLTQLDEFLASHRTEALLKRSLQVHLRPFNGHHAQVPVLDFEGAETREFTEWLEYAQRLLQTWRISHPAASDLWVVPELGPVADGYGLSTGAGVTSELRRCAARIRECFR